MDRGLSTTPDTTNNYDTNVVQPDVTKNASLYPAEQYSSCPQAIMGLNYDWTTMNQLVSNMSPNGNTNQAIGLQLGWLSLVGGGPFYSPPMDPAYTYTQVIILLTDGLNTQDRWYTSQSSIDARQQLTCNNIKAAGITLYTIQVEYRRRPDLDVAAELREFVGQVLPADVGKPDHDRVHADRHQPQPVARRQVSRVRKQQANSKAAARNGRGFLRGKWSQRTL